MCMICSLVTLFNLNTVTKLTLMSIGICIEVYMCSGWFFKQSINWPTGISPLHILWTAVNMGNLQRDEIMNYPFTLMAASIDLARCRRIGMVHLFYCAELPLYNT